MMYHQLAFLLALTTSALVAATPSTAQRTIAVAAQQVYLADIDLSGGSSDLAGIPFCESPALGQAFVLTFQQVSPFLGQNGIQPETFGWTPQTTLRVTRKTQTIGSIELLEHLEIALADTFPQLEGELKLAYIRSHPSIQLPAQPFELTIPRPPVNGIRSRFLLPFELNIEDQCVFRSQAALKASVLRPILVSDRRINRGEALDPGDFTVVEQDVLSLKGTPYGPESDLTGLESKTTLPAKRPLLQRNTGRIPVVDRGDLVQGVVRSGAIYITMKVEILDQGAPGDVVRVRNPKSKKQLKGIVQDDSTIQIL